MSNVKKKASPLPGGGGRSGSAVSESRSVFHSKLPLQLDKEHDNCLEAMTNYVQLLQQLCGAGSHVASAYAVLLKDTAFSEIAGQFQGIMTKVESACSTSGKEATADIEKLWCQLSRADDCKAKGFTTDNNTEISAQGLMCFLQMQCNLFQTTTDLLRQLACSPEQEQGQSKSKAGSASQSYMTNATQKSAVPLDVATLKSSGPAKAGTTAVKSPNSLRKQLSSFFAKIGSKSNSTAADGPTHSLFYVDLGSEADSLPTAVPSAAPSAGQRMSAESLANAVGVVSFQPGSEAAHPEAQLPYATPYPTNGQIATQEELDSVIDFLSRGPRPPIGMAAIPENQPPVMSRAVGSQLVTPQVVYNPQPHLMPATMAYPPPRPQSQFPQHLPDGVMVDPMIRDPRTNTWPIKPSQRHMFGQELAQMMQLYGGAYDNLPQATENEYSQYLYPVKQAKRPTHGELMPGNNTGIGWQPGGDMGMRMWHYPSPSDRPDQAPRQWSTVADSSSCSDESSSNGEVPWMIGLDLVNAVNKGRRHSSAEENLVPEPVAPPPEKKSSTLDSKSTNTWPPKQVWGSRQPGGGSTGDQSVPVASPRPPKPSLPPTAHRPLTPQWSDPLMNKSLSVWDPGLTSGVSQPSLPTHPADGTALGPRPVPPPRQRQQQQQQQERKY